MTTETRFTDLLDEVPRGSFYDNIGNVLPYRSGTTNLRLLTSVPNTNFLILINDIESGITTTDVNGEALFDVQLPLGDVVIELQQEFSTNKIIAYVTTRDYGVWYASYAEQLERIDDFIDSTLNSFYLDKAGAVDIDLAHGVRLLTPNEFEADLATYREILQFMRQAFRQFAGRLSAKRAVVAAITQVNPLIFDRSKNAPRWILGYQQLLNGNFQNANRPLDGTDLATEINLLGQFVTLIKGDPYVNTGSGTLIYNRNFSRFKWLPADAGDFIPPPPSPRYIDNSQVTEDGQITVLSNRILAFLDSLYPASPSNDFSVDTNSRIYLNMDGRGEFEVLINPVFELIDGDDANTVVDGINKYLHISNHYESARFAITQPSGSLLNYVEVVNVSDGTQLGTGTNPPATQDTATLKVHPFGQSMRYTAPQDSAGAYVTVNPGETTRLVSDNGVDFVDVLVSKYNLPSNVNDTFIIGQRYIDVATTVAPDNKIRIQSKNPHRGDGPSNITVLDGPFSQARNLFGLDQKFANLTANASSGATQVTVPNGTMESFSSVNGSLNLPFDVIVGRGPGPTLAEGDRDVTASATLGPTALIENIVGLTLNRGLTHVRWIPNEGLYAESSINHGIHPILDVDLTNNECTIKYNGFGVSRKAFDGFNRITGVQIIAANPTIPSGTIGGGTGLTLDFQAVGNLLRWKRTTAGSFGPTVSVSAGGYFRLYDTSDITTAKWIDVLVDAVFLPGGDDTGFLNVGRGFISTPAATGGDLEFWSSGEKVRVTNVTPAGSDEIWDLESPVVGEYDILFGPYEVLPYSRQPPVKFESEDSFGDLDISIDFSEEPATDISQATILTGDPELPTGWIDRSPGNPEYVITPEAKYEKGALLINDNAGEVVFEKDVSFDEDDCGYLFVLKAWVRNVALSLTHSIEFNLEFDFGGGPILSSNVAVGTDETVQYPKLIEFSQVLPSTATQFKIRIRRTDAGDGAEKAIVEKAVLLKEPFDSLFLGDGTIPRSGGRSAFGSLFYVWSPEELTSTEVSVLGIDSPTTSGLIRDSHNAHEQIDSFDVTDIDPITSDILNVRGAINETDWLTSTLTNLEVIPRNPTRFSYLKPILPSLVEGEELTAISQIPPHTANLFFFSDQDQGASILYENGIPVPNNNWQFNTSVEIEVTSGFVPGAVYTIDYNKLTRVETPPIDLDSPPNNGVDKWFADFVIWNRHLNDISTVKESISIFFDAAFNATLPRRSDRNKITSTLTEETGVTRRVIPQSAWRYVDSLTVNINGNQFNPNALYSLDYNQRFTDPSRVVEVVAEVRSANTAFSLSLASYTLTNINGCIDSSKRFHQLRLSFKNITDIRDLRVHSAILKGLNMNGAGSPPPGF